MRRVPRPRCARVGLGVSDAGRIEALLRQRAFALRLRRDREAVDTFSCYRRRPLLQTARARNVFVQELSRVREEMKFRLIGYVVMPEHVHLLLSEPAIGTPSTVLQRLKQRVSRRMSKRRNRVLANQLRLGFDCEEETRTPFWQVRFYDFNVYSDGKKSSEKLNFSRVTAKRSTCTRIR